MHCGWSDTSSRDDDRAVLSVEGNIHFNRFMKRLYIALLAIIWLPIQVNAAASEEMPADYLNSMKVTFLSWFSGSTKISYERAFPEIKQSGEICASLICAGYDKYKNNPMGFTVRYGHKFFLADNKKASLRGFYLRPEVMYSHYYYDAKIDGSRQLANMGAILGTVGYQYVYKRFLADAWVGAGYAYGNKSDTGYYHGFQMFEWLPEVALSFSIRLGVCF